MPNIRLPMLLVQRVLQKRIVTNTYRFLELQLGDSRSFMTMMFPVQTLLWIGYCPSVVIHRSTTGSTLLY